MTRIIGGEHKGRRLTVLGGADQLGTDREGVLERA